MTTRFSLLRLLKKSHDSKLGYHILSRELLRGAWTTKVEEGGGGYGGYSPLNYYVLLHHSVFLIFSDINTGAFLISINENGFEKSKHFESYSSVSPDTLQSIKPQT